MALQFIHELCRQDQCLAPVSVDPVRLVGIHRSALVHDLSATGHESVDGTHTGELHTLFGVNDRCRKSAVLGDSIEEDDEKQQGSDVGHIVLEMSWDGQRPNAFLNLLSRGHDG